MKIKSDFITNSSTTSFVAWGVTMNKSDFRELIEKVKPKGTEDFTEEDFEELDMYEFLECVISEVSLDGTDFDSYDGSVAIGKKLGRIREDETLLDFKKSICNELSKIGIKKETKDLVYVEEAWRDG